jgi:hypothetical protein
MSFQQRHPSDACGRPQGRLSLAARLPGLFRRCWLPGHVEGEEPGVGSAHRPISKRNAYTNDDCSRSHQNDPVRSLPPIPSNNIFLPRTFFHSRCYLSLLCIAHLPVLLIHGFIAFTFPFFSFFFLTTASYSRERRRCNYPRSCMTEE